MKRLLIANRGEIACRVISSAKQAGWHTVAIYSSADANARHVRLANEAHLIGEPAPEHSYLNQQAIIALAQQLEITAIHPGYGFLSENAAFASLCEKANIHFVGPSADAIDAMGDKANAKAIMADAGVPVLQDYRGEDQSLETLSAEAGKLGFPLLIKATCGGGGRGMRIVADANQFATELDSAKREAKAAFGDDKVLLEPYLQAPRHVEVQILADQHGNAVYLGDRDCSVQRRHQKVVEEAPAPGLSDQTRQAMGEAAVRAAKAINYRGAGTVEFLLDSEHRFYFMEMNTRLQVEHPVTELVFGVDLVDWQLKIASGELLTLIQDQLQTSGHAIEVRICAEDPSENFLPCSGKLNRLKWPHQASLVPCFDSLNSTSATSNTVVRVDSGFEQGDSVPPDYDSMLAKLIVHADTRADAAGGLLTALAQTEIAGVANNLNLLQQVLAHPVFSASDDNAHELSPGLNTSFLEHTAILDQLGSDSLSDTTWHAAALAEAMHCRSKGDLEGLNGFRLSGGKQYLIQLALSKDGVYPQSSPRRFSLELMADGTEQHWMLGELPSQLRSKNAFQSSSLVEPICYRVKAQPNGQFILIDDAKQSQRFQTSSVCDSDGVVDNENRVLTHCETGERSQWLTGASFEHQVDNNAADDGSAALSAPLHGTVVTVEVSEGEQVESGQLLMVMEAMKMEYQIKAPAAGTVEAISYKPGDTVERGAPLLSVSAGKHLANDSVSNDSKLSEHSSHE
ncbi:acetyl/propionyl/methylcrotonyl-CoA carboxylase subunit alpha [Corallincola platygyrae]|uniref:Acetyl/propionyl/methylcrotonyl-CoA carboxylase subunit alpha n=1 Tax=Corallincola platygyrae TaxID=1193278 RepID=A0ABW4XIT4_9GAMM